MNTGTIAHVGLGRFSLTSAVLHRVMSELKTDTEIKKPTKIVRLLGTDFNKKVSIGKVNQNDFSLTKNPRWAINVLKMAFKELHLIDKEKFDIELMLAELKDGHDVMAKKIIDVLLEDESIGQINEFISWSNQYLAQLIYAVGSRYLTDIDELLDHIVNDERQKANHNDLFTIRKAMDNICFFKTLELVRAKESSNCYPISREGISLLKEFNKLTTRVENMSKKINEFSKNKVR